MKKVLLIMLFMLTLLFSFACGEKKIKLEINGIDELEQGTTAILKAEYNGDKELSWSTSDSSIVFCEEGYIKGVEVGSAVITVTDGDLSCEKTITVTKNIIEITIKGINSLFVGDEYQFEASLSKEVEENVTWSSSDENILEVNSNGVVTAKALGSAVITASVLGNLSTYNVTVIENNISIIGENKVMVGSNITLSLNAELDNVTWSSSDDEIAVVKNGVVTALKKGSVVISATINGKTVTHNITVYEDGGIIITGGNTVAVEKSLYLTTNIECDWYSENEDIAFVLPDGEVVGISIGTVKIIAIDKNDKENKAEILITVTPQAPIKISIAGENKVSVKGSIKLEIVPYPVDASTEVYFKSSDESIATIDENGYVTGVKCGVVTITATSKDNEYAFSTINIEVMKAAPDKIELNGKNEMDQGSHNYLEISITGDDVSKEVIWETSDPTIAIVYDGIVLGVNKGKVTITAKSVVNKEIYGSIEINVKQYEAEKVSQDDLNRVNQILNKMTLSQKVGQMFVVGFSGTTLDKNLVKTIEEYNFGNVIYMGYNVTDYKTLANLSDSIQNEMVKNNGVPGFITIDQEGGRVARLVSGGTHFISNMAMAATNNYENTYLEGAAMGKELRNYGINLNFAPVLDVNNNPDNPVIGIRSYSDNPLLVSLYGKNMFTGLQESNVMGCSKHFPGHGNTSVDSHYGLPTITTKIDELYQTELAPFISAVANGIDSIMTTHIIFTAIDSKYPATLSKKVLTDLLRNEIGYDGLIITDGMEMNAVNKYFGDYDKTGLMAVEAGADILTYTTNTNPKKAHEAIMNAVKNGVITEERINESVRRILLKKLKYDILDGYKAKNEDLSSLLKENEELNVKFATESVTLLKGEFNGLDKNKSTLIISPSTSYSLGGGLESNSFACYAAKYLKEKGFKTVDYYEVKANISSSNSTEIVSAAKNYDQIVVAMSNVKTSGYTNSASFVNKLAELNKELLVIALDTPYDIMSYSNVNNYVCVYGYQKASVIALTKYLNGEFTATGKSPISEDVLLG